MNNKVEIAPIVRVSYLDFKNFLRSQDNQYWEVSDPNVLDNILSRPVEVDELMQALELRYELMYEYLYILNPAFEEMEAIENTDWDNIPKINDTQLSGCIIPPHRRSSTSFLYFCYTEEDACNANFAVLSKYKDSEEKVENKAEDDI